MRRAVGIMQTIDSPRRRPLRGRVAAALGACLLLAALLYAVLSAPRTIHEADSPFGGVRVVEHRSGVRTLRTLDGRAVQSAVIPGRPLQLQLEYTRVAAIGLALVPDTGRILFVGLGAGAMPMHARRVLPRTSIDVVEIDPLVIDVAHRFLGFRSDDRLRVHAADGRAFIEAAPPARWDLVVLDAFSDDAIPEALATVEFLEIVKTRLSSGGSVVANLWTAAPQYPSMLATYHAVFPDVHLIRVGRRAQNILVARPYAPLSRDTLITRARDLADRAGPGFDLAALVAGGHHQPAPPRAAVLRDR